MAIAERSGRATPVVQSASNTGAVTASYGTLPKTAGDLYVACVTGYGSTSAGAITETTGTWTKVVGDNTSARASSAIFILTAAGGDAAPTFNCTFTGTASHARMTVELYELYDSAGGGTPSVDTVNGIGNADTSSATSLTPVSAGPVPAAGCFAITSTIEGNSSTGTVTFTRSTGWTNSATTGSTSTYAHSSFDTYSNPTSGATISNTVGGWTTNGAASVLVVVTPYVAPPPPPAGVSWVQGTGANGGGATVPAPAYGVNLTPGNWMAAWVVVDVNPTVSTTPTTTAVVASTGETFTKLWDSGAQNITVTNGSNVWNVSLWVAQVAGGAGAKPTITPTIANAASSSGFGIIIGELYESTGATALALDGAPAAAFPTGNYSSVTTPAFSDTTNAGMLWALYADWGLNNAATNNGAGYTTTTDVIPNSNTQEYLLTKTASGGAETAVTFTFPSGNTGNPGLAIMGSIIAGSTVTTVSGSATAAATAGVTAGGSSAPPGGAALAAQSSVSAGGTVTKIGAVTVAAQASVAATSGLFITSVSSNGRYLLDQNGSPILVNGDTPWNVAWASNATDQETYLADRASYGCNSVMVDLIGNTNMSGNASGANWNGETPGTWGTGTFTANSTYWSRIDTFFQLCQKYGITAWAMPLDSYATTSGNFFASITTAQATAFGTFLGNRYKSFPNIVWMIGNDYDADGPTGGQQNATPSTAVYTAMLAAIQATGDTHLMTSELAYYESNSSDGTATWSYMKINGAYCYHPTYEGVLRARNATPTSPVVMIEAVYDQATTSYPDTALDMRKICLWPMTCGASGQFYGNDYWWPQPSGWLTALDTTNWQIRARMMSLFKGLAWQNLQPDTSHALVTAGYGTQWTSGPAAATITPYTNDSTYGNYVTAAYTSDGTLAVIYNPTSATLTLSASVLGSSPTIKRVDPVSGTQTSVTWTTSLASPGNNSGGDPDWLYIITASPPGVSGTVTVAATSSVTVGGVVAKLGTVSPAAQAATTVAGTASAAGAAHPASQASVSSTAILTKVGAVSPASQASITVGALASAAGTALPAALASVSAVGVVTKIGIATPASMTTVTAGSSATTGGSITVSSAGAVVVGSSAVGGGTSTPQAQASVAAAGTVTATRSATPAAQSSVAAGAGSITGGSASPHSQSSVTVSALAASAGAVSAAALSAVTVGASAAVVASVSPAAHTTVIVSSSGNAGGSVTAAAVSSIITNGKITQFDLATATAQTSVLVSAGNAVVASVTAAAITAVTVGATSGGVAAVNPGAQASLVAGAFLNELAAATPSAQANSILAGLLIYLGIVNPSAQAGVRAVPGEVVPGTIVSFRNLGSVVKRMELVPPRLIPPTNRRMERT